MTTLDVACLQELLAQLQAEHADALDAAYSELAVQQGARQRLDAALAAASVELAALQHEAAATEAALACRVAALEQEQRDRCGHMRRECSAARACSLMLANLSTIC